MFCIKFFFCIKTFLKSGHLHSILQYWKYCPSAHPSILLKIPEYILSSLFCMHILDSHLYVHNKSSIVFYDYKPQHPKTKCLQFYANLFIHLISIKPRKSIKPTLMVRQSVGDYVFASYNKWGIKRLSRSPLGCVVCLYLFLVCVFEREKKYR